MKKNLKNKKQLFNNFLSVLTYFFIHSLIINNKSSKGSGRFFEIPYCLSSSVAKLSLIGYFAALAITLFS